MVGDQITLPVKISQYMLAHLHLARVWSRQMNEELTWFLQSMRGELPPRTIPTRNWTIQHIALPPKQYLMALEAVTTRLGVKPQEARA